MASDSVDRSQLTGSGIGWSGLCATRRVLRLSRPDASHSPYVIEATWFQGRPLAYAHHLPGCLDFRWPLELEEHRFSKGQSNPAGSGAERLRPLPELLRADEPATIATPHSWLICGGQRHYSLRVSALKERSCGADRAADARGVSQLLSRSGRAAARALFGCAVSLTAAPRFTASDPWWSERRRSLGEPELETYRF